MCNPLRRVIRNDSDAYSSQSTPISFKKIPVITENEMKRFHAELEKADVMTPVPTIIVVTKVTFLQPNSFTRGLIKKLEKLALTKEML